MQDAVESAAPENTLRRSSVVRDKESAQVLVFDMDGVLVDVSESYRETIVRTVEHFTGRTITRAEIQDYKNQGGWNNDWALSQKICKDLGVELQYSTVVDYFNYLFLDQGMIHRERWLPRNGLLDRLGAKFELAIFTGRTTEEAEITLKREGVRDRFLLISANDVECEKPAPEGLLKITALRPAKKLLYVGDTVDDARCARAANVPFIGIASPKHERLAEILDLFRQEGAIQILGDINEIG
jgi:HAD superfamily hydrolase (TIGR01548 family)